MSWLRSPLTILAIASLAILALAYNCGRSKGPAPAPTHFKAAPTPTSMPGPVSIFDETGHMTGTSSNPMPVTGTLVSVPPDGGVSNVFVLNDAGNPVPISATSLPLPTGAAQDTTLTGGNALVQVINDGGNPVPVDTPPGELKNSVALLTAPGNFLSVKGSAGTFVLTNFCDVGSSPGYWTCFDQATPDAGGLIDSGAAPFRMTPYVPAGSCGNLPGSMSFSRGMQCYVSSQAGVLVQDAGVPNFIAEVHYR